MAQFIPIPDLLPNWPWPRRINPHYEEAKAEATAWIEKFKTFDAKERRAYALADSSRLAAIAYPDADRERLQVTCNLMNVFWLFDETSDLESESNVKSMACGIMDALRNPEKPRPRGESPIVEAHRQFWRLAMKSSSPTCQKRFIKSYELFMASVIERTKDRDHDYVRSLAEYFAIRRNTIGSEPSFVMLEMTLDIPEDVYSHEIISKLMTCATDMIVLSNDLFSYNVEQARGDAGHNIITILMQELNLDLDSAVQWISDHFSELVDEFLALRNALPSWSYAIDMQVKQFVDGLGNWVRANDAWSFETGRYFLGKGAEVQKCRKVALLPQKV